MKKILIVLVLLCVILLAAVYLVVPGKLKVEASATINAALPGISRSLADDNNWEKWWPGQSPFRYDDQTFSNKAKGFSVIDIDIYSDNDTIHSRMSFVPVKANSLTIEWEAEQVSSANPFKRLSRYQQAMATEKNMNAILEKMKIFMENTVNIYGFDIKLIKVTDSVLISTRRSYDHQPTPEDVNAMIQDLKKYISDNNAGELNFPMLNVFKIDSSHYEAMTAIPVDRQLPHTNEFAPKFLLKGGNILEADVKGGPYTIESAIRELDNYRTDYKYTSPAISYQLLVTDRVKEQDTTKWVTKLYYPVF